ncbi:hypothetical protein LCGC14_0908460 [marine sediment metagenome]|uniref:VCBS repeat-containing protein n=1 Tax=marine sediment metagenome TaxID=412755 RepID=A0A0F9RD62_9ZZZZ
MNARSNPHPIWPAACAVLTAALLLTAAQPAAAQPGWVLSHQKISATEGGFTGILNNGDWFGGSAAALGDLDGDGVTDLAVGAPLDDDGGAFRGAVWVLFLNTDGTVKRLQKISNTQGGFTGTLDNGDYFGSSLAALGDLDGDGLDDLAVGAFLDDDGGNARGAVWVLFLDGVTACPGDLDGDGDTDLADLGILLSDFGCTAPGPCVGDLDNDGDTDLADFGCGAP